MALGGTLLILSNTGMDPYGVLLTGLVASAGISVGVALTVTGVLFAVTAICAGVRLRVGTLLNPVIVAVGLEVFLRLIPSPTYTAIAVAYAIAGIVCVGVGVGLWQRSGVGVSAFEALIVAMARTPARYRLTAWTAYASICGVGVALHGAFGVTTIAAVVCVPWIAARVWNPKAHHSTWPLRAASADPLPGHGQLVPFGGQ